MNELKFGAVRKDGEAVRIDRRRGRRAAVIVLPSENTTARVIGTIGENPQCGGRPAGSNSSLAGRLLA